MLRYAAPLFLAAFLLFQVQPMIARCILPWFGGAPSVWTTCMLFFQVLLVLGYAYAHLVTTGLRPRAQATLHVALVVSALGLLAWMAHAWGAPLVPSADWKPQGSSLPVLRILYILLVAVGLPYFVLATTSPLMQAWFSRTAPGVSPYRLYSLSNAGSLLALISYPFVVEPALAQRQQGEVWSVGFALFAVGCVMCAAAVWSLNPTMPAAAEAQPAAAEDDAPPALRTKLLWIALPALASLLLLAVTNHLCQDIAVTPFLWVLPLSLYLLSFIICFDHERWYFRPLFVPLHLAAIITALVMLPHAREVKLIWQIVAYGSALFICCMTCHGELVALKPKPRHLTSFYLAVSVGGALGGLLVGIVAPVVFRSYAELPIGLALCFLVGLFAPIRWPGMARIPLMVSRVLLVGLVVFLALSPAIKQAQYKDVRTVAMSRNFYGVLRVEERNVDTPNATRTLLHGRIIHGFQFEAPEKRRRPTSYYGPDSGLALAVAYHPRRQAALPEERCLRIGVAGLGVGTMSAFCEPGDYLQFYEINPDVKRLAEDTSLFTYLADCPATWRIVMGDARLSMERELAQGSQQYDLLLLDAFSGDAVPAHLLTEQAFRLYIKHLRPGGALCVDVSNAVLDLPPVIWQVASRLGMDGVLVSSTGDRDNGYYTASWMILTPGRNYLRDAQEIGWSFANCAETWEITARPRNLPEGTESVATVARATGVAVEGGPMTFTTTTAQPMIRLELAGLEAIKYPCMIVSMRIDNARPGGETARLFWTTTDPSVTEPASMSWTLFDDGQYHDYVLRPGHDPLWKGRITSLRLQPCSRAGARASIESVRMNIGNVQWSYGGKRKIRLWTDDYYNLFQILR